MKVFYTIISWFILNITVHGQQYTADTFETVMSKKTGTVTVLFVRGENFAYMDNGEPKGIEVEIFQDFIEYLKVKKNLSVNVKWIDITLFSTFYEAIKQSRGGVFGLSQVSILEERMKEVGFSPPYMKSKSTMITNESVPTLRNIKEIKDHFKGMTFLALKGTTHEKWALELKASHFPDLAILYIDEAKELIEKLQTSSQFFTYLDLTYVAGNNFEGLKRHPPGDLGIEEFGIIMPLSSSWKKPLKEFFEDREYLKSTEYSTLLKKYFGRKLGRLLLEISLAE